MCGLAADKDTNSIIYDNNLKTKKNTNNIATFI